MPSDRLQAARARMRELAADLDALRPFLDTVISDVVSPAWSVALERFRKAVSDYHAALVTESSL